MDGVKKYSAFLGRSIVEVNTEEEAELSVESLMTKTIGEIIDAFNTMPDLMRKLTFGDTIDILTRGFTNCEEFGKELLDKLGINEADFTEEDFHLLETQGMVFAEAMGRLGSA